jgi:glycosyltransferase involved in cell wall biosynthesis
VPRSRLGSKWYAAARPLGAFSDECALRILLIGKFPPIQGGVSTQTFWTAHELAELGHVVHVVTNSGSVELGFRQLLFGADQDNLTQNHETGAVHIHTASPIRPLTYIPWSPPYVSQLFGLAADLIAKYDFDVVLGWYFEPYGAAAAHVAKAFDIPLILRHAGSDIGRLAQYPDLQSTFGWMARQSKALFTTRSTGAAFDILSSMGFTRSQCVKLQGHVLPSVYSRPPQPLDLPELAQAMASWYRQVRIEDPELVALATEFSKPNLNAAWPTIATYGKVGKTKGTYDLIGALDDLASAGVPFNHIAIGAGRPHELRAYFRSLGASNELRERIWVLPPLAPWRIPSFLSLCDAVGFLERDFPITFHYSSIPREVLAAGRCLICSVEMARKLPVWPSLVDGKNCILIEDPRNRSELRSALLRVLTDEPVRISAARHGRYLSEFWESELARSRGFAGQIDDLMRPR